jgi:hypothetical protein
LSREVFTQNTRKACGGAADWPNGQTVLGALPVKKVSDYQTGLLSDWKGRFGGLFLSLPVLCQPGAIVAPTMGSSKKIILLAGARREKLVAVATTGARFVSRRIVRQHPAATAGVAIVIIAKIAATNPEPGRPPPPADQP